MKCDNMLGQSSSTTKERNWSIITFYQGSDVGGYKRLLRSTRDIKEVSGSLFSNLSLQDNNVVDIVEGAKDISPKNDVLRKFNSIEFRSINPQKWIYYYEVSGLDGLLLGIDLHGNGVAERSIVAKLMEKEIIVIADPLLNNSFSCLAPALIENWGIKDFMVPLNDATALDYLNARTAVMDISYYVYAGEDNNKLLTFSSNAKADWHIIVPCGDAESIGATVNKIDEIILSLEIEYDASKEGFERLLNLKGNNQ